ncbi:MAG TPA: FMN-binding glutamate synthase family protein, partial [Bacillota bacterium]
MTVLDVMLWILSPIVTAAVVWLFAVIGAVYGVRRLLRLWSTVPASETPLQLALSLQSTPPWILLSIQQRAETGDMIIRPMGSRRPGPGLDAIDLVPAQLSRSPLPIDADVDLAIELCSHVPRPVRLELPVFVAGMGYGLALSREAKLALVRGAALAGTAIHSGEGAFVPEEPVLAYRWFYQIGRGQWTHRPELVRLADLVEIHAGQGAEFGAPLTKPPFRLGQDLARTLGLSAQQPATIPAGLNWRGRPLTLAELVELVRGFNPFVPIGVKLGAGDAIEEDLAVAVAAGVDFITIDGGEAATGGAPASLNESVGIPLLHALHRAVRFLERCDLRGRIALIASGGLREPADFVKVLALGADAVAIGSAALFAISHRQVERILPRPPLRLVLHGSRESQDFNVELGAHQLANYLESCRKEMQLLLRTLGKRRVGELDR